MTLITKTIDTTSISYQPLWLCSWRGDISSFLFTLPVMSPLYNRGGDILLYLSPLMRAVCVSVCECAGGQT